MEARDFQPQDFARFHPGGSLGRKLLTRVKHEMKSENLPFIPATANMKEIIHTMTDGRLGLCIVNNGEGIITDGDLRRQMEENTDTFLQKTAGDIMKRQPKTIDAEARLSDAEEMMTQQKITSLLVSDQNRIVGVIQIYDLNR